LNGLHVSVAPVSELLVSPLALPRQPGGRGRTLPTRALYPVIGGSSSPDWTTGRPSRCPASPSAPFRHGWRRPLSADEEAK